MKATAKEDCGYYGMLIHPAGTTIEVEVYIYEGKVVPGLFRDADGSVWPDHLLNFLGTKEE